MRSVMIVSVVWRMLVDVVLFWHGKLLEWYYRRTPVELWLDVLRTANEFDEWEEAALHLDGLLGLDLWRNNATSDHYDYRLIHERLASIEVARDTGDINALVNLLRSGLVRNLGNITAPKLYNRSFAGTKFLIEEYITQVAEAIEDIGLLPTPEEAAAAALEGQPPQRGSQALLPIEDIYNNPRNSRSNRGSTSNPTLDLNNAHEPNTHASTTDLVTSTPAAPLLPTMTTQNKLDFIHDTRQAFGRSTLVLQGGAIFGLCHLGVVKALFLRGLLPRIITGTATGALIAALVAIHTEEELPRVLKGDGIDLSAFSGKARQDSTAAIEKGGIWGKCWGMWSAGIRRVQRFRREGYFLDVKVLEECVRANVGDLTFEEAYQRSKRVLNITVATAGQGGIPTLLNYLTAPNVLVWTAAVASNASSPTFYGDRETRILCKDPEGRIVPWKPANTVDFRHWTHAAYSEHDSPLLRIAELFNVNHFIVSQARPYLIPFLQSDMHGPSLVETRNKTTSITAFLVRMMGLEIRHRLKQLDTLRLLPAGIRRFLVDERVPGASMTLVPEVTAGDFVRLMEVPTKETLEYWISKGERSVWPAVAALKIRCAVETELDRAYQQARRLKAGGLRRKASAMAHMGSALDSNEWRERERRERDRAHSTGARCLPTAY